MINIKIAKAYRTISFEASRVMARVPQIELVIEGKVQMYKRKQGLENSDIVCDMPLPINEWPHPARLITITKTSYMTTYPIEIYTDGSKDRSMVGAAAVIYSNKQLVKQIQATQQMFKQPSRADCYSKGT